METFTLIFWHMGVVPDDPHADDTETYKLYRLEGLSERKCERLANLTRRHLEARCVYCLPDKEAWADTFFPTRPIECSMRGLGQAGLD